MTSPQSRNTAVALCITVVAATAAALYYFWTKRKSEESKSSEKYTRKDVLQILEDVAKSQEEMKVVMKQLTKELIENNWSFDETYKQVEKIQPADPLERHQISMRDFDELLENFQDDQEVRNAVTTIMGTPSSTVATPSAAKVNINTIIEIHQCMLTELKKIVEHFDTLDKTKYDVKTVTIAAQALVAATVEKKFSLASDDIESAVIREHFELSNDQEFSRINNEMQMAMSHLLGYGQM